MLLLPAGRRTGTRPACRNATAAARGRVDVGCSTGYQPVPVIRPAGCHILAQRRRGLLTCYRNAPTSLDAATRRFDAIAHNVGE